MLRGGVSYSRLKGGVSYSRLLSQPVAETESNLLLNSTLGLRPSPPLPSPLS